MKIRICGNIMAVTGAAIVDHSLLFVVNFVLFTHFGPRDQPMTMKLKKTTLLRELDHVTLMEINMFHLTLAKRN